MRKTVILANGAFPRKGGEPRRLLESAARIVACDGAADSLRRHRVRCADFVVGDLDSVKTRRPEMVRIAEQDTNDLDKAIGFCRGRQWKDLVIVGASGGREDHLLGNVFRAMAAGVEMVTDEGRFIPASRVSSRVAPWRIRLNVYRGCPISVFTDERTARMKSSGLKWKLDGVVFDNLYCATLNRADCEKVEIRSTARFFTFVGK